MTAEPSDTHSLHKCETQMQGDSGEWKKATFRVRVLTERERRVRMGVGREQKRATIPEIHMVENELKQCVCVGGWGGG